MAYKMSRGANKTRGEIDEFLKDFKSITVDGKRNTYCHVRNSWTSVTEATFTKFSSSATFDVVSGVSGPQTRSTTAGFSDQLHGVSQLVYVVHVQ